MFEKIKTYIDHVRIMARLSTVHNKHPMDAFVYGMWNRDKTHFYIYYGGKLLRKSASDIAPFEILPSYYHRDFWLVDTSKITLK